MDEVSGVLRLWQIQDEKCQGNGEHTVDQGVKSAWTHLAAPASSIYMAICRQNSCHDHVRVASHMVRCFTRPAVSDTLSAGSREH